MQPFPWSLSKIESLPEPDKPSATSMLQASEDAIASDESAIHAWSWLGLEEARERARLLSRPDSPCSGSPLCGVPYAVKDIFDTAGIPTEWGTETQRGRVPDRDSGLVARLNSLGGILLGKTHTTAYAYFDHAPTRNPRNPDHTPGGSSSGSAAAVAAGMVPLAIGSQTQGSVLRPASFCGVVGFKPTYGLLPLDGVMPFAPTLDHAGLFAPAASDIRVAWRALGFKSDAAPVERITIVDWPPGARVEPEMATAFRSAVQCLSAEGLLITHLPRPAFVDSLPGALRTVMAFEAAREHGERYRVLGQRMGSKLSELLDEGLEIRSSQYRSALQTLHAARNALREWLPANAIIATPAAPGPAPAGLESTGDPRCNAPYTALGVPAVSVPMPVRKGRLPMGLQLTACSGKDSVLLATAVLCERLLGNSS